MYETDEQLYNRFLLRNSEEDLRELMERYGDSLTRYLDGYIHDLHDAEDLMIEAFARVVRARPAFSRESTFRAYLYKTGRNLAFRFHARLFRRQTFSLEEWEQEREDSDVPEELNREVEISAAAEEKRHILRRCMDRLEPELREALWLVYFENMSYAESARIMDIKQKRLDHLLQRGKRQLRAELAREEITDAEC